MTNIEARRQARIEIAETLKSAGLLDGITLTASQMQNETRPAFWRGVVRDEKARAKDLYVTWHIPSSSAHTRADNQTMLREVTIAVDVFSKRSFDSEMNHKLIERIETALTENGYEVEMASEQYENYTKLFHLPMTAFKLY